MMAACITWQKCLYLKRKIAHTNCYFSFLIQGDGSLFASPVFLFILICLTIQLSLYHLVYLLFLILHSRHIIDYRLSNIIYLQ